MTIWTPNTPWKGKDVFVLGGGRSMMGFDWSLLKDRIVLGCNYAFQLGHEIVDAVLFCDKWMFEKSYDELQQFYGAVYLNPPTVDKQPSKFNPKWAYLIPRERAGGLSLTVLGWNSNTGTAAINLALLLGAKRVYLLGIDMKTEDLKKPDWYTDVPWKCTNPAVLDIFENWLNNFKKVKRDLASKFPGCEIININSNSALDLFETVSPEEFFEIQSVAV